MLLMVVFAAVLVGCAVMLVGRAVGLSRARAEASLAQIGAYGYRGALGATEEEGERRSLVAAIGALVAARMDETSVAQQRSMLLGAGMYRVKVETFLGFRVLAAAGCSLLAFELAASKGGAIAIVLVVLAVVTGWKLPSAIVGRRATDRIATIDRAMPEFVDLLVVGVESGIGFDGAIQAAVDRIEGPLGEEMRLTLREQNLGASSAGALENMLQRCDTPAMRSFVRTTTQGQRLGVPVGQMMRSLAGEMRKRRRAQAEEAAHKTPVKILFPLVLFIFPAIFIVLLTPACISIIQSLGS